MGNKDPHSEKKRYSRLKNVKEFGYNIEFKDLRKKSIAIIGVGGLGSVAAEMLARCGIGKLIIFDLDIVNEVNLNRMFFHPEHVGRKKVEVVAEVLSRINPDVDIEPHHGDIMALEYEDEFERIISEVDLVLNGLDNVPARNFLNQKCVKLKKVYIDAGAMRSGMGGYVQPVFPGKTACAACIGSLDLSVKRENAETCTASLPTTMTLLASLQVQEALKILLGFGHPAAHLNYSAITNDVRHYQTRSDPCCHVCGEIKPRPDVCEELEALSEEDLLDLIHKISSEEEEE